MVLKNPIIMADTRRSPSDLRMVGGYVSLYFAALKQLLYRKFNNNDDNNDDYYPNVYVFSILIIIKFFFEHCNSLIILFFLFISVELCTDAVHHQQQQELRIKPQLITVLVSLINVIFFFWYDKNTYHVIKFAYYSERTKGEFSIYYLVWITIASDYLIRSIFMLTKALWNIICYCCCCSPRNNFFIITIKTFSHVYRSLVTIPPWLSYFLDVSFYDLTISEKIIGISLSSIYMFFKVTDVFSKVYT